MFQKFQIILISNNFKSIRFQINSLVWVTNQFWFIIDLKFYDLILHFCFILNSHFTPLDPYFVLTALKTRRRRRRRRSVGEMGRCASLQTSASRAVPAAGRSGSVSRRELPAPSASLALVKHCNIVLKWTWLSGSVKSPTKYDSPFELKLWSYDDQHPIIIFIAIMSGNCQWKKQVEFLVKMNIFANLFIPS